MELLPSVGQQDKEFFFGSFLEVGHRGYDGVEIETRIYVMVAACRKQRLYDAHVLSRLMVATEEIVLASERDGTDLVLGKIVVKQKPSVIEPKAQDDFRNIFIRIIDFYSRTNRSTFAKKNGK